MTLNKLFRATSCFLIILLSLNNAKAQATDSVSAGFVIPTDSIVLKTLFGRASFYADKFHGRKTASGAIFSHAKLTAACNMLPLRTWIEVLNLDNGKCIVVLTNDRLAPKSKRLIDLTKEGARQLDFIKAGLANVKITVVDCIMDNAGATNAP